MEKPLPTPSTSPLLFPGFTPFYPDMKKSGPSQYGFWSYILEKETPLKLPGFPNDLAKIHAIPATGEATEYRHIDLSLPIPSVDVRTAMISLVDGKKSELIILAPSLKLGHEGGLDAEEWKMYSQIRRSTGFELRPDGFRWINALWGEAETPFSYVIDEKDNGSLFPDPSTDEQGRIYEFGKEVTFSGLLFQNQAKGGTIYNCSLGVSFSSRYLENPSKKIHQDLFDAYDPEAIREVIRPFVKIEEVGIGNDDIGDWSGIS